MIQDNGIIKKFERNLLLKVSKCFKVNYIDVESVLRNNFGRTKAHNSNIIFIINHNLQ